MPRTGDNCERSGQYEGVDEHVRIVSLSRGQEFPPCPACNNSIEWKVVGSAAIP
jgi:hypothetical protein